MARMPTRAARADKWRSGSGCRLAHGGGDAPWQPTTRSAYGSIASHHAPVVARSIVSRHVAGVTKQRAGRERRKWRQWRAWTTWRETGTCMQRSFSAGRAEDSALDACRRKKKKKKPMYFDAPAMPPPHGVSRWRSGDGGKTARQYGRRRETLAA